MFQRAISGLRPSLYVTVSRHSMRQLTCSAYVKSDIHSEILNILREDVPVEPETSTPKKKKSILILGPEKTRNKEYAQYVASLAKKQSRAKKTVTQTRQKKVPAFPQLSVALAAETLGGNETGNIVDDFRKAAQGEPAVADLCSAFTRAQLATYIETNAPALYRVSHNKRQLAEAIIEKIWGSTSAPAFELVRQERIPLTHQEMFLLLSQRGAMLRLLKATVTSLDFDSEKRELIISGTESQLQNAQINLTYRFENARRELVDLATVQALYEEKFGYFAIEEIGRLIEVYFQHVNAGTYELCALNRGQVRRIKRLLVWFLNYNLHAKSSVHLPETEIFDKLSLVPFSDDYAMVWNERPKTHFQLVDETQQRPAASSVDRELSKFSEASVSRAVANADFDVSPREFHESSAVDETFETLTNSGLFGEESIEDVVEDLVGSSKRHDSQSQAEPRTQSGLISAAKRDQLYAELTDFSYRQGLHGVSDKLLDPPIFTVTLGRVLFQQEKEKTPSSVLPVPPQKKDLQTTPFTFSSNIPHVYDRVLHEGLADCEPGSQFSDPHSYTLQFRFLPSPYVENETNGTNHNHMKYPPLEMWMPLNENKVVDVESMQLVTVEGENDSYMCLPSHGCDLKISCQKTGRVIGDEEAPAASEVEEENLEVEDTAAGLDDLFDAPSSKYPRLVKQKGVQQFLEDSRLNFSGKSATAIAPFMDVDIGGNTVRYEFISVNYRRELDIEIGLDQMVQVSIVDGGSLGGRRAEVRFIGDFTAGVSRSSFDALMDSTCRFVEDL